MTKIPPNVEEAVW